MAKDEESFDVDTAHLPAVRQAGEVNLFGGSDPVAVVERATEVATALAAVIERQQLFTLIRNRKHVRVEGWTLLGSMLGVFPVVEWTRQTEDGWEARCVAKTRDGADVGAAEAMCSRRETKWKTSDEYAIRSMAQTRATSKALRLPLGFVMALAGYDATPAEEMDIREDAAPSQPDPSSAEFDPGVHVMVGAPRGEGMLETLAEQMKAIDPTLDWRDLIGQIEGERDEVFWRRLSNAVTKLLNGREGDFPLPTFEDITEAFAWAFGGQIVAPNVAKPEEPAPIPADKPVPEPDETIPFQSGAYGEERP